MGDFFLRVFHVFSFPDYPCGRHAG
jgi:hypothetical protein